MNLKVQVRTIDLFTKLVNGNINKIAYIGYQPQKADVMWKKKVDALPRCKPEEEGISSEYVRAFVEALVEDENIHTQGIMIARNGRIILEAAFKPYDLETWRITHSMSKTIVGIAIGIAIEEGLFGLDDTVASIFNKTYLPIIGNRKKGITIRNLLTMSSGISYNEVGSLIDTEWTKDILESQVTFEPGKEFAYNSMNTYLLSAIIQEKTGITLFEYVTKRIFEPMNIVDVYWENSPENKTKGGWGLYITLEDRIKIGQLFLNEGNWDGVQIVSKDWLKEMMSCWMVTPEHMNVYGYGYQGWIGKRKGSFVLNGVLGQNTIIYPDLNMVITIASSNTELFVRSRLMDIVDHYFSDGTFQPGEPLKENQYEYMQLKSYLETLYFQKGFERAKICSVKRSGWSRFLPKRKNRFGELLSDIPEGIDEISFETHRVEENGISIMPLFIQTIQNNFSQGMTLFQFAKKKGRIVLRLKEHEMQWEIPIGFKQPYYLTLDFHGEHYKISSWGVLKYTEDDVPVLKLQFCFLETTNCRNMKFYFYEDHVLIKSAETPDLNKVLDEVIPFIGFALPANGIETIKNSDIVQGKVLAMVEPEVNAFPVQQNEK